MGKGSSRYKTEEITSPVATQLLDGVLNTLTGGLIPRDVELKVIDTKTGEAHTGSGTSYRSAHDSAHSKFGKK